MIDWVKVSQENDKLFFDFRRSRPPQKTLGLDAAVETVQYILKNYPAPYTLCVSGGVDSQAMLYAWHLSGVPFSTFSAKYNFSLNSHDLETLHTFSNLYNIPINFVDFDLLGFLEHEHKEYTKKYFCGSPHITTHMKFSSLIESGTTIFSGNFLYRRVDIGPNHAALYRYSIIENKPLVPWFFLETEKLAYAFLDNHPEIHNCSYIGLYDFKIDWYQYHGFPVIPQKKKYTGFEYVKDYIDQNPPRKAVLSDYVSKTSHQNSKRLFDLLYRNKYEAKYNSFYKIKYEAS